MDQAAPPGNAESDHVPIAAKTPHLDVLRGLVVHDVCHTLRGIAVQIG